ncbi:DUF2637 domain-containing protein [Cellulosimicrobium sp. Marseille-Q4280]|uniref:DUF2637 domain-containing protein n=1 Tax=Cellulosimicrobium sp. Marseille-Q4280 TaxID=2937992 RepID=UPI00203E24FE|nr:DUF2637 domain-containing protein [Cellulosimicrobium sp. Marseille-Q4280]
MSRPARNASSSTRTRSAQPVARTALTGALIGTAAIAAGAFWLSFYALADLAGRAGVPQQQVWVWPLIVDGVIIVATVAVFALRGHARALSAYPWALLIGGVVVSVAANAVHAVLTETEVPDVVAIAVATVPPIALVASTHLSALLLDRTSPAAGALTFPWPRRRPAQHAQPAQASAPALTEVPEPAPAATTKARTRKPATARPAGERTTSASMQDMRAWYDEQLAAGVKPTGAAFAARFGTSEATGRRRLAELREDLVDA